MKRFLNKIIEKIVEKYYLKSDSFDKKKMQEWLYISFKDHGFAQYYTMRKKLIINQLASGLEREDYLIYLGRIQELKALSLNINMEGKLRLKKDEEEKKKSELGEVV